VKKFKLRAGYLPLWILGACVNEGNLPDIKWSQDVNAGPAMFCKLNKNKSYYSNIVYSRKSNGHIFSDCHDDSCVSLLKHA
jgi:hypothetical protein